MCGWLHCGVHGAPIIKRIFLDWSAPALPATVDHLVRSRLAASSGAGRELDLHNVVVALPGGRAGRRLLELLVERADNESWLLVPPRIVTAGQLPELLYAAQKPFADELTQRLAWIEALREMDRERLGLVIPQLPEAGDLFAWLSLGDMLSRLHTELAADALNFGDVAQRGGQLPAFDEAMRWTVLAELQQTYLSVLDRLELWDLQTARRVAVERRECRTEAEVVLVGAVDLNQLQRKMLDQVAERVTALVFAPPELAGRFDDHGCLRPEAWQDAPVELATEQIEIVERPGDQADAAVRAVASFVGHYAAEEIVLGVPDERLVPYLEHRFAECDVPVRYGPGKPVTRSGPCRLLEAAAEYAASRRFDAFSSLLRHPAIARWLISADVKGDWLTQADTYYGLHLPSDLRADLPESDSDNVDKRDEQAAKHFSQIHAALAQLLAPLTSGTRPLGDWGTEIVALLREVYGSLPENADLLAAAACESIVGALKGHAQVPDAVAPTVTGAEALQLVLLELARQTVPPAADSHAIELLGWLELPLDDAPALVLTGFNEGSITASRSSDLFLPNELRRHLWLEDNDRIFARDVYALSVLAASKAELRIIAGRRSTDNDPLAPSRLLFNCDDDTLAQRVKSFFEPPQAPTRKIVRPGSLREGGSSQFVIPRPLPLEQPVTSMKVTEFRDYLACPYRYYLRHQLKLQSVDDAVQELDGGRFGTLLHDVVKSFGEGPRKDSINAAEIHDELYQTLDRRVAELYGPAPLAAVKIQVEHLRLRLGEFARRQAEWAAEGWRIQKVEQRIAEQQAPITVDGQPMFLRGQIDRIDRNERTGEWIVLDYKTGDSAKSPEETHREKNGEWIDLQLPLYRHLVAAIPVGETGQAPIREPVRLGYVVIPKALSETAFSLAEWDDAELATADETVADVIRHIRAQEFWPPATDASFFDEFAAICQEGKFGPAEGDDVADD